MLLIIYFFHQVFTFNPKNVRIGDTEKFAKNCAVLGVIDLLLVIGFVGGNALLTGN